MKYGKTPKILGTYKVYTNEMFYYQYLPIKMKGTHFISLENRLECFEDIIDSVITNYQKEFGYKEYFQKYAYLTAKRLFGNSSYSKEEIQELLKNKREAIKRSPEYYGNGSPSKNPDYLYYKKILLSKNNS